MMQKDKFQESLDFVSRHYRYNAFSAKEGFEQLDIPKRKWWRSRSVAAAAVGVALVASAAIYSIITPNINNDKAKSATDANVQQTETVADPLTVSRTIAFDDADLSTVVAEIETVYGVKIKNVPTEEYRLTLRYEGTAEDLITTINEILEINLKIAQ